MPCRKRMAAALRETVTSEDGVKMYTWRAVRRQHLYNLRKQTRTIVFFMALIEILRVGAVDMVYAGKHDTKAPGPEDYGIAYNIGYFISWLYLCLFAIIFVPFFSWWVPSLSSDETDPSPDTPPSKTEQVVSVLQKINSVLLPACIGLSLIQHIYYVISAFIYVEARPVDSTIKSPRSLNSKRSWMVRGLLLAGILITIGLGQGIFSILEYTDLARVKTIEQFVIVLPIQVNLGILLGSAMQFKAEQRNNRKMAARKILDAEAAGDEEKQRLLVQA